MLWMIGILVVPLGILAFWIYSIKPNKITGERRKLIEPFQKTMIAHRGLFSNHFTGVDDDIPPEAPENTLEAFRRAVDHGYGIEMDVQLSKDGQLVVFHDGTLKRACKRKGKVIDYTYEELSAFPVFGSKERIPLFKDVLKIVDGKVPLLIEVKPDGDCIKTCESLNAHLEGYEGVYIVESFDPRAVRWYRKNRPDVLRGQLSEKFKKSGHLGTDIGYIFLSSLMLNLLGRPDFIAYNHKHKEQFSYRLLRRLFPVFNAAWTIRSQEELEMARDVFSVFIFDSFIPKK